MGKKKSGGTLSNASIYESQNIEKKFTGREQFIKAFQNTISTKVKNEQKILVYFGVGGIGKTTLRKELGKCLDKEKNKSIWTSLDFDNPSLREEESALLFIRNQLNEKYKIDFPLFDIAYTVLWQKMHPETQMTYDNYPLFKSAKIVSEILHFEKEIPLIGFIIKLTKAFNSDKSHYRKWWEKKGKKELANLPLLNPKDISMQLHKFLSKDLKEFLENKKKNAVIFFDTYDALLENLKSDIGYFEKDEWIRKLVSQLPDVIWVICGREKLRWDEQDEKWNKCIEQHLLGNFSSEDSGRFLKSCGIQNKDIQNVIITASKGVPYFLDLAIDTYYEIKTSHNREPKAEDFAKIQDDVLKKFLKYLDNAEIETLKILSTARMWDNEIFRMLLEKFCSDYFIDAMENLYRFSFIGEPGISGIYTMHDLMSEVLQKKLDTETRKKIHKTLFDYYNEKLRNVDEKNIDENAKQNLIEANFHCKKGLNTGEYLEWFYPAFKVFNDAAYFWFILPICEETMNFIREYIGEETSEFARIIYRLAVLYNQVGKYKDSELFYRRTLEKEEKLSGTEHFTIGMIKSDYSGLLTEIGRFSEAEQLIKKSIDIFEKNNGKDCYEVFPPLNNLSTIYSILGRYNEAELLLKREIYIIEKFKGANNGDIAQPLINLSNIYLALRRYEDADENCKKSLLISEKNFGEFHPSIAMSLNTLGNIYLEWGKFKEAEPYYNKAVTAFEFSYGPEHPQTATAIHNLAYLYFKLERYDEAHPLYLKVLKIFQEVFEDNHPSILSTQNNLGLLLLKQKKYKEAGILMQKVLKTRIEVFGIEHLDNADSYNSLAVLNEEQNNIKEAIEYYEKSKDILAKALGKENSEVVELSKKIEKLRNKKV